MINCEAKITKLSTRRVVIVVRDITDRVRNHEAQKRLVAEATARASDAAANRFVRHEVKNGLLASIALCEGLADMHKRLSTSLQVAPSRQQGATTARLEGAAPERQVDGVRYQENTEAMDSWFTELDATLTSTLNTVLSEAMARDLVYDKYKPNPGVVDVKRLLQYSTSLRGAMSSRMSLEFDPPNFPRLFVDPHLLHCIYRNAVSNAFKYGSPDGQVRTIFHYDLKTSKLKLEVINDPGPAHADLVRLDPHAVAADVFGAGTRLHTGDAQGYAYLSSGDGGWIMSKVAQSLGGSVDIVFEEARTVLTLECPVHTALGHKRSAQGLLDESILEDWSVPANVWGIAVDDSSMQRLLLTELLEMAGIHPSRMVVTGGTVGVELKGRLSRAQGLSLCLSLY